MGRAAVRPRRRAAGRRHGRALDARRVVGRARARATSCTASARDEPMPTGYSQHPRVRGPFSRTWPSPPLSRFAPHAPAALGERASSCWTARRTTIHVAAYDTERTELRVAVLRGTARLEPWCAARGYEEALVGGFFVRPDGTPLGEVRTRGVTRRHVPFAAPWASVRACVHVQGGVTIDRAARRAARGAARRPAAGRPAARPRRRAGLPPRRRTARASAPAGPVRLRHHRRPLPAGRVWGWRRGGCSPSRATGARGMTRV